MAVRKRMKRSWTSADVEHAKTIRRLAAEYAQQAAEENAVLAAALRASATQPGPLDRSPSGEDTDPHSGSQPVGRPGPAATTF